MTNSPITEPLSIVATIQSMVLGGGRAAMSRRHIRSRRQAPAHGSAPGSDHAVETGTRRSLGKIHVREHEPATQPASASGAEALVGRTTH